MAPVAFFSFSGFFSFFSFFSLFASFSPLRRKIAQKVCIFVAQKGL